MIKDNIAQTSPDDECGMDAEVLSRRSLLRGVLAIGCGLALPGLLSGCDSKQAANPVISAQPAPPAAPSAPATATAPAAPAEVKMVTPASVLYQQQPKDENKCSGCMNFIAESNTCKRVEGQVSPDGWCVLWMKKA